MSDVDPSVVMATPAVWWADLTNADLSLVGWLDDAERGRLDRLDLDADRGRFLVGAALLRVAVADATGHTRQDVTVTRTCARCGEPHGAPRVSGTAVSVAHAAGLVVVATAPRAVGIDVERAGRGGDVTQWVQAEARFKAASVGDGRPLVLDVFPLAPPLPGYRAAIALPSTGSAEIVVHDLAASAQALRAR